ncbi:hypothetical protein ACFQ1I_33400 [Kitasatospora arboriphila]
MLENADEAASVRPLLPGTAAPPSCSPAVRGRRVRSPPCTPTWSCSPRRRRSACSAG